WLEAWCASGPTASKIYFMAVVCLPDLGVRRLEDDFRPAWLLPEARPADRSLGSPVRDSRQAPTSVSRSRRTANAVGLGSRASLEDFLASPRRSSRPGRVRAVKPTQRQPIDDSTSVPAEVYQGMLRLADEARARATHRRAFAPVTGELYLEHSDAARIREERMVEEAPKSPSIPEVSPNWRRPSSCATEVMERGFAESSVPVPLQVI
ncbi:unnamed protein product, partial [Effrenium voratum]